MEIGESSGLPLGEKPQLGGLEVKVVSKGRERSIERASVMVTVDRHGHTGNDGILRFQKLRPDAYDIRATRRYPDEDYVTFVTHYPAVKISHEATGRGHETASVEPGMVATRVVKLDFYRILPQVVIRRNHIIWKPRPGDDKFGHWWIEIDGESYGWWPKYNVNSWRNRGPSPEPPPPLAPGASMRAQIQDKFAYMNYKARSRLFSLRHSPLIQTLFGVEGELNGVTSFRGTPTLDPHARRGDPGHERYHVIATDEEDDATIKQNLRRFARGYSGSWSWRFEFGQNCHSFQIGMLGAAELWRFRQF